MAATTTNLAGLTRYNAYVVYLTIASHSRLPAALGNLGELSSRKLTREMRLEVTQPSNSAIKLL